MNTGYAKGDYTCTCLICSNQFTGDKRAVTCSDCAITSLEQTLSDTQTMLADVRGENALLKQVTMDAQKMREVEAKEKRWFQEERDQLKVELEEAKAHLGGRHLYLNRDEVLAVKDERDTLKSRIAELERIDE